MDFDIRDCPMCIKKKIQNKFSHFVISCVMESVRTRVMGMRSLISFTTLNIPWYDCI